MNKAPTSAAPVTPALLAADEPPAFDAVNLDGKAPFLLVCDHASRRVPRALGSLGLDDALLRRHIAWDIGAVDAARWLSRHFDAPLLLTGYSRLVVDCNRNPGDPSSIPEVSDGIAVPGNHELGEEDARHRIETLFEPYHRAVADRLTRWAARGLVPALLSIHSFTPVFGGAERPWHIGILWDKDPRIAVPLMENLRRQPGIVVGDNEPYSARDPKGYTVTEHAAAKGYPHVAVEIRQDLIDTHHDAEAWAARLAEALQPILRDPSIYRIGDGG